MKRDQKINELNRKIDLFVTGEELTATHANAIALILEELWPDDELMESRAEDLAMYQPGGGESLFDYETIKAKLIRLKKHVAENYV